MAQESTHRLFTGSLRARGYGASRPVAASAREAPPFFSVARKLRRRRARQVGRADWRPALGHASSRFGTEACRGPGTVLSCVERVERAPQVDELSAWRSRGILRGHVPALRGDAPTHAPRASTGAQMRAAAPARARTRAHAQRTASLCRLPRSFLADARRLASRWGECPLVLRHNRARRPRALQASVPKRELAWPKAGRQSARPTWRARRRRSSHEKRG